LSPQALRPVEHRLQRLTRRIDQVHAYRERREPTVGPPGVEEAFGREEDRIEAVP
jgi:hypothetical protein